MCTARSSMPGDATPRCAQTAAAAGDRRWNDANVLVMSLRLTSPQVAREMLDAWFVTAVDPGEAANIARLEGGSG
jgi:ribose 5-phosphate isomerase B